MYRSILSVVVLLASMLFLPAQAAGMSPQIEVLSNRSDLVSGDDALVAVSFPGGIPSTFKVFLNANQEISDAFHLLEDGRLMGLVEGLRLGPNNLRVTGGGASATVEIINHPNHGPVFSAGQHRIVPCDTQGERPADCDLQLTYDFLYKSSNPAQPGLIAFDPEDGMPSGVAMTTTDNGVTLPFIVRRENGFQDRDRYTYLVLFDLEAEEPWTPWNPQPQWNGKMFLPHGSNCGMSYVPQEPELTDATGGIPGGPEHSYVTALGRGWAVMSTALNDNGHNCDVVLQAESMVMAKERFVEQYGAIRYAVGTGCSGGAIAQITMANAYPGIYQGLLTTCTYPDSISPAVQAADYNLMRIYFENPSKWGDGVAWSPHQFGLVEGHLTHVNAVAMDELLFKSAVDTDACTGLDPSLAYHPQNNPTGIRCGAVEWYKHIWGTRTIEVPAAGGDTVSIDVSNIPTGNRGIQYGLQALQQGQITPAQFVDLNVKIGGLDYDFQWIPERSATTEPVVTSAMRSGAVTVGNNLDSVAIINFLGPDPGAAHDSVHAWWVRWRLDREHGHHDNHVMWGGPAALFGDPFYFEQGLLAMDRWLAAVEADRSDDTLARKIVANRPEDVHDQCSDGLGHKIADEICVEFLRHAYAYGTPRTIAGANKYAMNYECQLKPLSRDANYGPVPLTDAQWNALESVFPEGICDYQRPGFGEDTDTVPWLTYQDGEGGVITGGRALPARPENSRTGWSSPGFME